MSAPSSEALVQQITDVVMQVLRERGASPACPPKQAHCSLAHGVAAQGPPPAANPLLQAGAHRVGHSTEGTGAIADQCAPLAGYIDHTLLKPTATDAQVEELCIQARDNKFASVCVNPAHVALCARLLRGSGVMVCTVVGFPLGMMTTEAKAFETADACAKGADEIDMVINVGKLQQRDFQYVCNDIRAVVQSAQGRTTKVILETSHLNDEEKVYACVLAKAAGADFVKTSTGFQGGGATVEDVALMRKVIGADMGVKASGGVRDCESARKMVEAGADRLGTSASVAIVQGKKSDAKY